MNLDDESLLSGYLDDELDPADRLGVAWAVAANPALAEQLRLLTADRDLVAGLDRPAVPRDLAPGILNAARRARRRRTIVAWSTASVATTALAAGLLISVVRLHPALHPDPDPVPDAPARLLEADRGAPPGLVVDPQTRRATAPVEPPADPVVALRAMANDEPAPSDRVAQARVALDPADGAIATVSRHRAQEATTAAKAKRSEAEDQGRVVQLLERPNVRRIVIVTDVVDASDRVRRLIQQDARLTPEFAQLAICQGIVIDPDHTEAAEVFAVPMHEGGRAAFVAKLRGEFPSLVAEETPPAPSLVTNLTEVGQVAFFRDAEAATLGPAPMALAPPILAAQAKADTNHFPPPSIVTAEGVVPRLPDAAPRSDRFELTRAPAARSEAAGGPPGPPPSPPLHPADPVTVLVWVTRSGSIR